MGHADHGTRYSPKFNDEDLVLGEYGAAVIGLEIQRRKSLEREEEERLTSMVQTGHRYAVLFGNRSCSADFRGTGWK